jgi:hypothetical protein
MQYSMLDLTTVITGTFKLTRPDTTDELAWNIIIQY